MLGRVVYWKVETREREFNLKCSDLMLMFLYKYL